MEQLGGQCDMAVLDRRRRRLPVDLEISDRAFAKIEQHPAWSVELELNLLMAARRHGMRGHIKADTVTNIRDLLRSLACQIARDAFGGLRPGSRRRKDRQHSASQCCKTQAARPLPHDSGT